MSFEICAIVADDDTAAMEWITRGRSRDGEAYENRYLGLFGIRDGRIASVREYLASAEAAQALFGS